MNKSNAAYMLNVFLCIFSFANIGYAAPSIVEDGQPKAQIVIADKPPRTVKLAAAELRDLIKKISGAELPIVTKTSDAHPVKLYVGKSEYTDKLDIKSEGFKDDSYRIVSGENCLVLIGDDADYIPKEPYAKNPGDRERAARDWDKITGARWDFPGGGVTKGYSNALNVWIGDGHGSLNAVYDFLRSLGARWYFPGEFGECLPEMKTIALPKTDKTVKPDFSQREIGGSAYNFSKSDRDQNLWVLRLGLSGSNCLVGSHGISYVLHHDNTRKAHPEWFMLVNGKRDTVSRGGKPCLSAEGLLKSNIEFGRTYFDIYGSDLLSVMPTDGYVTLCQCDLCKDKGTPERGYSGSMSDYVWGYVNSVAKELYKTHPDKEVNCGAYTAYMDPPLKIDKMSPNVGVMICQSRRSFSDPKARAQIVDLRRAWLAKLSGKKPLNLHDNYSSGGDSPFPVYYPHIIAEDIRSLKGICRGEYIEENSVRPNDPKPALKLAINHLNIYVTSRLWWDADQDVDAILNEYYEKYYGPASREMKAFIEFSEAKWNKMDKDADLITKAIELIAAARKAAGEDSIYAKRVALVDSYLSHLKQLRDKVALGRKDNPHARVYDRRGDGWKIAMDGKLDEDFWKGMATYKLHEIKTGGKPAFETTFRSAWKDDKLYFGIYCKEDDTKKLNIGTTKNEDTSIWNGDTVEILLETQNHAYYQIAVNPSGAIMDLDRKLGQNTRWNSDAKVATFTGGDYWSMEICIPVANEMQEENLPDQLVSGRRPTLTEPWYFNVGRVRIREKDMEASIFAVPGGSKGFHDPGKFGILYMEK